MHCNRAALASPEWVDKASWTSLTKKGGTGITFLGLKVTDALFVRASMDSNELYPKN